MSILHDRCHAETDKMISNESKTLTESKEKPSCGTVDYYVEAADNSYHSDNIYFRCLPSCCDWHHFSVSDMYCRRLDPLPCRTSSSSTQMAPQNSHLLTRIISVHETR